MSIQQANGLQTRASLRFRRLLASVFVVITAYAVVVFDPVSISRLIVPLTAQSSISWGKSTVQIRDRITGIKPLDSWLNQNVVIFAPSLLSWDPLSRMQARQLSLDLGILYIIFLLESARRSNTARFANNPNMVAMASQLVTVAVAAPVYFLLHFIYCAPLEQFSVVDHKLQGVDHIKTVLPAVIMAYYLPFYMMFGGASNPDSQLTWMMVWQFYPVWAAAIQFTISKVFSERRELSGAPRSMTMTLYLTVGSATALSIVSWWDILSQDQFFLSNLFLPNSAKGSKLPDWMTSLVHPLVNNGTTALMLPQWMMVIRKIFQADYLAPFGAGLVWLGYMYGDMLKAGVLESVGALVKLVAVGAVILVTVGPGATLALGWCYRDVLLSSRSHRIARAPNVLTEQAIKSTDQVR